MFVSSLTSVKLILFLISFGAAFISYILFLIPRNLFFFIFCFSLQNIHVFLYFFNKWSIYITFLNILFFKINSILCDSLHVSSDFLLVLSLFSCFFAYLINFYWMLARILGGCSVHFLWGANNGSPLQCSCLKNPRDWGAWWATVYGVAQSRTWLQRLSSSSSSSSNTLNIWKLDSGIKLSYVDQFYPLGFPFMACCIDIL